MNIPSLTLISALALCLAPTGPQASPYSPAVDTGYPKAVYFGDLHLHSNLSADAFSMGNLLLDPADAFRFARGQEVRSSSGLRAQLKRPLDFLAVTDHAEFLGIYRAYELGLPELKEGSLGRVWQAAEKNKGTYHAAFPDSINDPDADRDSYPEGIKKSIWTTVTRTADDFNDPGIFTTFSGYEWTSMVGGSKLHRCVIFRDESELTARVLPFSAQQSRDPEDLWQALQHY